MRCTWSLVALPYPTTACFTSFDVYWATSQPDSAAAASATPAACPVAMAVRTLTWKNTRSTTTATGRYSATNERSSVERVSRRSGSGMVGTVVITPPAAASRSDPWRVTTP